MSQKFKSDIETQAGLIDSFGFTGTAGQVLSSTGTKTEWITPPQSPGGGGSSQVFYFNGGTASSVGGYYQMSPVANIGTAADFTINANGYIASFLTDVASPNQLNIPAGNWNFEIYFSASSSGGSPSFYVELYKYSSGGVFTLIASSSAAPEGITNGTALDAYFTPLAVPTTTLLATDRLAVRVYVTHSGRTITMHTQNGHLSEVITTFSTGLTALNGLTEQVQYFSTGTAGTDFNIASAVNTHTFNLPTASAINRGALSSADWITFNSKANASGTVNYVSKFTGSTTLGDSQLFDNGTNVGIGTTSPTYKFEANSGTSQYINARFYGSSHSLVQIESTSAGFQSLLSFASPTRIYSTGLQGDGRFSIYDNTANLERFTISTNGNVGIGTTGPNYKLDVLGDIGAYANGDNNGFIGTAGGTHILSLTRSTNNVKLAGYDGVVFYTNATTLAGGSERMRIGSNGAIKFNSYGSGTFTGTATQRLAVDSSGNVIEIPIGGGAVDGSGTTNYVTKWTDADTIGNSQIFDNGANVGIGTNIPSAAFQVGNGTGLKNILISGSGNNLGLGGLSVPFLGFAAGTISTVFTSAAVPLGVGTRSNQPLILGTNNAEVMRIAANGNVSIGSSAGTAKLNVRGPGYQLYLDSTDNLVGITSSSGGEMLAYNGNDWSAFNGYINFDPTIATFRFNNTIVSNINNSLVIGTDKLPNQTSYQTNNSETLIGVRDVNGNTLETGLYLRRSIYCENTLNATLLSIAPPNSSIDLVAKIGYGDRFFIAKISVIIAWSNSNYTYKITSTNTTSLDDSSSVNINFNFELVGSEFFVKLQNLSGEDIYANINANIL
jgi:hypothetical protein